MDIHALASFHQGNISGAGKDQENGGLGPPSDPLDGLVGVLFSTIRHAYSPPSCLAGSETSEDNENVDRGANSHSGREGANHSEVAGRSHAVGQDWLAPGCDNGFGGGVLDLRLAEQCSSLLRELYKVRWIHGGIMECFLVLTGTDPRGKREITVVSLKAHLSLH